MMVMQEDGNRWVLIEDIIERLEQVKQSDEIRMMIKELRV